jgi:hypothetical protein
MKKLILLAMILVLYWEIGMAGEVYRWTDDKGTVFFSDSPPPYGSFKKEKVEDQSERATEKRRELEKTPGLSESDRLEEKLKIETEYQKKAKSIRDYDMMRQELRILEENYQKKYDEFKRQWNRHHPGSTGRSDINKDIERANREYKEEIRKIKDYYGYY